MTHIYGTHFDDHLYLLELSTLLEPRSQYSLDYTFQLIDSELATYEQWEPEFDRPKPTHEKIDCTPYHWYSQRWFNCALLSQTADFDEDELFDLFDYHFYYDSSIYTGDFLDLY